jgi:hypothetical protein
VALALALALAGCGERGPGAEEPVEEMDGGDPQAWIADEVEEVTPAELQVFQREGSPATEGRLLVHALVPDQATQEEVRVGIHQMLRAEAAADPAILAVRLIAYGARPRGQTEAELVPIAWGELVPPGGWDAARPGATVAFQRIYTYFGAGPDW